MFKNMKLGAKIGAGFAALLIIAMGLGALAMWNMVNVKGKATLMVESYVPEVGVANLVERTSWETMYNIRAYGLVGEKDYLDAGRAALAKVESNLAEAMKLGKERGLTALVDNAGKATTEAGRYKELVDKTEALETGADKIRETLNESAAAYMKECAEYLKGQNEKHQEEIGALAAVDDAAKKALTERAWKITVANDIVDLGNATRIAVWRGMAQRDATPISEATKNFAGIGQKLEELKAVTRDPANLEQIAKCKAAGDSYLAAMNELLKNMEESATVAKARAEAAEKVLDAAQATAKLGMEQVTGMAGEAESALAMATMVLAVGLGCAFVVGVLMAIVITRSITKPINRVIEGLTAGSEQVSAAAGQVAQSSQSMAEGASEQASSLEETSASLEEMASMTRQNADNANQANSMAGEARESAERGTVAMERMIDAINKIKESSDQTAKILKTIDEIAFQTNLLALNAAVEAARAGEAGKGFAVVAEEVRNLAQRSAEAAKNTATLIEGAQKNSDNGVAVSAEVADILRQITDKAQKVSQLVSEVSVATNEQSQGIDQVNTAVSQMDKVTQANAANSEEAASASEELSAQAGELENMVSDLLAIVGGAGAASGQRRNGSASKTAPRKKASTALPASAKHHALGNGSSKGSKAMVATGARHEQKVVNPEEVIPLDEDDFKDF